MFEKRQWVPADSHPGASDLNRIEDGIADNDAVIERIKALPRLENGAKAADITKAYNALIDAVNGIATVDHVDNSDNQDNVDNQEQKEGE